MTVYNITFNKQYSVNVLSTYSAFVVIIAEHSISYSLIISEEHAQRLKTCLNP